MSDYSKSDYLIQYQTISNKLKKKRILKKPNVAEASQQFEHLGINFERENLPFYAGLCYQAAAKCQNSLGNSLGEGYLLLRSSRHFMSSYLKHMNEKFVPNESFLYHSYMYYVDCLTRFQKSKEQSQLLTEIVAGDVIFEMAENLSSKGHIKEGCHEYEKALEFFFTSPVEKINCLQRIASSKIKLGNYFDSLKVINHIIAETNLLPDSGLKEVVLCNSEITKTFLLLILQPTPQQISCAAASALEKYAWVKTSIGYEVKNLQTTLNNEGLSMLGEDLFLKIQSLVMACQYCDSECLELLKCDLVPYLNNEQKTILQILIKQYKT